MRRSLSLAAGAAAAAIFTHGMVFAGLNWNQPSRSAYRRFFQQALSAIERLWSYTHGWQPLSHIDRFGHFYAHTVHLLCPLMGFALFCLASRHKLDMWLWKPLGIAVLLALPPAVTLLTPFYGLGLTLWVEVARTLLIVW